MTVITSPYEKSDISAHGFISRSLIEGINLIVINTSDSNRNPTIKRVFNAILFAIFSSWYALRLRYNVVLASSGPITVGLPMILANKIRKKATIFEVRDLWPAGGIELGKIRIGWQKRLSLWFENKCYQNADLVITASEGQRNHIIKRYPKIPVKTISQASDIELFNKVDKSFKLPEWAQGKFIFTHIGSLGLIHNVNFILDCALYLKNQSPASKILIVLIGEGAERRDLESKVIKYGLDNVRFTGLLPKTEVVNWVHASVATLFTTLNNPVQNTSSPNKIFDSFAAGKPIIQTTTGWIKDLVDETECGINVDPDNCEDFVHAMDLLASSNGFAKVLGNNGLKLAKGRFNRDKLAQKYLKAIETTI